MRVFRHSSSLSMETMDRVRFIVDYLQNTVLIVEPVTAFHVAIGGSLLISKLPIVPAAEK